jgi:exodeoxyribonuclease VII small subunit
MGEEKRTFEEELALLAKCAQRLRDEDVSLEDAIQNFEEGIIHYKKCTEILTEAKGKIETYKE